MPLNKTVKVLWGLKRRTYYFQLWIWQGFLEEIGFELDPIIQMDLIDLGQMETLVNSFFLNNYVSYWACLDFQQFYTLMYVVERCFVSR